LKVASHRTRTLVLLALGLVAQLAIVGAAVQGRAETCPTLPLVPLCESEAFCVEAIVGCSRQQMRVTSSGTNTPVGDVSSLSIMTDGEYTALQVTMAIENPGVAEFVRVTPGEGCTVEPAQLICEFTAPGTGESARTLGVEVRVSAVGSTIVFVDISADGGPPSGSEVTIGSEVNPSPSRPFMVTGDVPMATRGDYEGTLVTESQPPFPDLHGSAFLAATTAIYGPISIAPTGTVTSGSPTSVTFDFAQDPSGTVTRVELAFTVITASEPAVHDHTLEAQVVDGGGPITLHAATAIVSNEVTIVTSDPTATEAGATTGAFTVSRDGDTREPLTVFYRIGGTATPGGDYVLLPGSVTIPAGEVMAPITVTPINDALVEAAETVVLTLAARPTYTVGPASSATVSITSNEVVTVVPTDPAATEAGRTTGTFTVRRSRAETPLIVSYTVAGTATPGSDYARLPGTVTIPTGALSANISVRPADDALIEGPEAVILRLLPTPAYAVGTPNSATVNITSNEVVTVVATDATASEVGRTTGTFTVHRTGNVTAPLSVFYTLGGTATRTGPSRDYAPLSGSVTIPAGALSAPITVTPIDDSVTEGTETVVLALATRPTYTVGSARSATVTITRISTAPVVTVLATDSTATEAGRTTGAFSVRRTGPTTASLTVFYTITGMATPGSDYATLRGRLTIPAGAASALIPVTPADDALMEGTETVVVTLAPQTAYTVGSPRSATVNIASNEVVTVVATDPTATEAGRTTGTFTVRRTGSVMAPLTVFYTLGGAATRTRTGSDYATLSGSVIIPAGVAAATVTVRPINDALIEGAETVVLALVARPTSYVLGLPSIATVTITSDD
jgi:hypothetical protein